MGRKTKKELNELCNKYNVDTLWSFSRYDTYKTDTYEYYLKYIQGIPEDRTNSIYCVAGNAAHGILEDLYSDKISYNDMAERYEDELFTMSCADLKYNRTDSEKNEAIANKYESCMKHFFAHHELVNAPHKVEDFLLIKVSDDIYFQGYADFIYIEKIGDRKIIHVVDYKTSTKYQGSAIEAHGKQLMLYAEGIKQKLNIPLSDIVCEWNFLKYVTVTYEQKNGNKKDRYIERNAIGSSLLNTVKMWLKHFGYDDEIEKYIDEMVLNNDIDCLPLEVRSKFEIHDCYIQVPLSAEKIEELKKDIVETIQEIRAKTEEYNKTNDEKIWWQEVTPADEYRLNILSGYSRKVHKPLDEYLKNKEMFEDKENNIDEDDELLDFINSL